MPWDDARLSLQIVTERKLVAVVSGLRQRCGRCRFPAARPQRPWPNSPPSGASRGPQIPTAKPNEAQPASRPRRNSRPEAPAARTSRSGSQDSDRPETPALPPSRSCTYPHSLFQRKEQQAFSKDETVSSYKTPTSCNTVQVSFLQSHSTCFGRQAPINSSIKKLARRPLVHVLSLQVSHHITIYGDVMTYLQQTAFWRGKNGEHIPCLKYSVPIFVE